MMSHCACGGRGSHGVDRRQARAGCWGVRNLVGWMRPQPKSKLAAWEVESQGEALPSPLGGSNRLFLHEILWIIRVKHLVAQLVKNLPAIQETLVWFLGWEDLLEKGTAIHCSILAWRIPWTYTVNGVTKSRTWLSKFHFKKSCLNYAKNMNCVLIRKDIQILRV